MTEANEGFFDNVKKFFTGIWNAFIRLLQKLVDLFSKNKSEFEVYDKEKGIYICKSDGKKYKLIDADDELFFIGADRKKHRVAKPGSYTYMLLDDYEKKKRANAEHERLIKEDEELHKKMEEERRAREEENRKIAREKQESAKRKEFALSQVVAAQESYNRKIKAISGRINSAASDLCNLMTDIYKLMNYNSHDYQHKRQIAEVNTELQSKFDQANNKCDLVQHKIDSIVEEINKLNEEYDAVLAKAKESGLIDAYKVQCSSRNALEFVNDTVRKVLINDTKDAITSIKRFMDDHLSEYDKCSNNAGYCGNDKLKKEYETMRDGFTKLHKSFSIIVARVSLLRTTDVYDINTDVLRNLLKA